MDTYHSAFDEQAVLNLKRHGYPWSPLLKLVFDPGLKPEENDPYFQRIASDSRESLKGRFSQITQEARRIVQALSSAQKALNENNSQETIEVVAQTY